MVGRQTGRQSSFISWSAHALWLNRRIVTGNTSRAGCFVLFCFGLICSWDRVSPGSLGCSGVHCVGLPLEYCTLHHSQCACYFWWGMDRRRKWGLMRAQWARGLATQEWEPSSVPASMWKTGYCHAMYRLWPVTSELYGQKKGDPEGLLLSGIIKN